MRKNCSLFLLSTLLSVAMLFFGCSSTPEAEPVEESEASPAVVEETPSPTADDSFSSLNEAALATAENAREAAVVSGAMNLVPDEFQKVDSDYEALRKSVAEKSSENKSDEIASVTARFQAMERLAIAYQLRERIEELGFENVAPDLLVDGDSSMEASRALLSTDGQQALVAANEACSSYENIVSSGFKSLCDSERTNAYAIKGKADEIKSAAADKDAYSATSLVLSGADASYATHQYESAYEGFAKAVVQFQEIYERVSAKRAAAEAAIARAKQKVDTTAVFAAEADEIAPLGEDEK